MTEKPAPDVVEAGKPHPLSQIWADAFHAWEKDGHWAACESLAAALQARPDAAPDGLVVSLMALIERCEKDRCSKTMKLLAHYVLANSDRILSALRTHDDTLEDAARLNWLQHEMNDIRWTNDSDDGVICRIVSHWQSEPQERVEGENWNENLRAAIDEARNLKGKDRT